MLRLQQEIEENRRSASNIIRLGIVEKTDVTTVDIKTGKNHVKRIPFFVHCAGRVSHYRRPSVGEQCILINLGSGDNLNNAVALMGLPSDQFPCPTTDENQVMTDYSGGMTELYYLDSGKLEAVYPGGMFVKADISQTGVFKNTGNIQTQSSVVAANHVSDGQSSMQHVRQVYNQHTHQHGEPTTSEPNQKME
ncbi:MAG: hypothetical protein CENE_03801 [Candidatus Celerinatantimonas neptuna]|nr:MAG: hypothetical protein CENE_03801 [Candidatus Celerinatantimonas neptuna]